MVILMYMSTSMFDVFVDDDVELSVTSGRGMAEPLALAACQRSLLV